MPELVQGFLFSRVFIPHGHCYLWKPELVGLHIASDLLIALSYYSIPLMLIYFVRKRRDVPFDWIFMLFGAFIIACGTTHLMEIWTLWNPTYWLSGSVKSITAIVSFYTACSLLKLLPKVMALPSPAQLEETNQLLLIEVVEGKRSQQKIRQLNAELEQRVNERTWELQQTAENLKTELAKHKRTEEELRLLQSLTQAISDAEDFDSALTVALRLVCEVTGWDYGEAWIPRPDDTALECSPAWYGRTSDLESFRQASIGFTFLPNTGLPGRVWTSQQPEWISDTSVQSGSFFLRSNLVQAYGLKAGFGIPILNGNRVLAVLGFFIMEPRAEERRLVELVASVAAQLGLVFQRKQLESERDRLASFPQLSPNPVVEVDLAGKVRYLNPEALRLFPDLPRCGSRHPFLLEVPSMAAVVQHLQKEYDQNPETNPSTPSYSPLSRGGQEGTEEKRGGNGESQGQKSIKREVKIGDVYYEQVLHYVAPAAIRIYAFDVTERKRAEAQLIHNAFYEALTQLPNRALFVDRLEQAARRAKQQPDYFFAVLFLDLDRFKVVNDSLGHLIGDQLLCSIAGILKNCTSPTDTVARFGGDEFAILLEGIQDVNDATRVADRIHQALSAPCYLDWCEVFTTVSIGIALSTTDLEKPEDLLRDADMAMYRAKAQGKACYEVFDMAMHAHAVARLQLETDLRRAVERQEFVVYYQPIISLPTAKIAGFEALLRWQHPERGIVSPTEFIPLAEETGLIVPIGWWTLREACRQLGLWQKQFPTSQPLTMNVNLSGKQFSQPDLLQQIDEVLDSTEVEEGTLKLEITESAIAEGSDMVTALLQQLQKRNIQLCIDDFGTGYSSLSRLQNFPINTLKIDRSFVNRIGPIGENSEIVRAIVTLAQNLGMDVVAEGVEVLEHVTALIALQCQYGQGFYFSRPVNGEVAGAMLTAEWTGRISMKGLHGRARI